MRGCHAHDHSASNREMWERPQREPLQFPNPDFTPPKVKPCRVSQEAVRKQGIGE